MTIHTYTLVVDIDGEPDSAHDTGVDMRTGKRDLGCFAIEVDADRLMFWTVEEGVSAAATAAGADPSSWPTAKEERTCRHCGRSIRTSGDPAVPWVHIGTGNSYCDVEGPGDAVALAGTPGRTEAEPEDN